MYLKVSFKIKVWKDVSTSMQVVFKWNLQFFQECYFLIQIFNSFNEKSNRVSLPCGDPWAHVKYVYLRAKNRTKPRVEILSERTFWFLFRLLPACCSPHVFTLKRIPIFPKFCRPSFVFCFQNATRCCDGLENSWKFGICLTLFNVVSSSLSK